MRVTWCAAALTLAMTAAACTDEGTVTVHRLAFIGVKAVDEGRLKEALATRQSSMISWGLWGKKSAFDRARFDADLKRIQAFYADRGYPDAKVTGFDVTLNATQDQVDLTVTIAEGEPVTIAALDFSGFDVIPPPHLDALRRRLPIAVGQPRDRQLVVAARELAVYELKEHGYPYAKVSTAEDNGPNGKRAALTFTAEPGVLAHFGPVGITGNRSVHDHIIERALTFKAGALYQRSLVQDSQRRLYGMELFQFANIELLQPELQPAVVPVRVTVTEGNHQRANFGVGYGTDESARVDAEYHHLNFLGGARLAGAHVRWSSLDRGARLDFNQPYFFRPRLSLGAEAQQWYTYTPAYRSIVTGVKLTVTHRSSERTSWAASMTSEHDSSTIAAEVLTDPSLRNDLIALGLDPTTLEQNGTLNAIGFDVQHSTADNLLDPRRGYQVAWHAEQAGGIAPGSFNYAAVSFDGRHYLPFGDSVVLASRVQIGNIRPSGNAQTNVPFAKRFLLGGATSIRGWGRYEVSPLGGEGLPIGGDSMLAFSEEIRAVLRGSVGGVLFLDAGNVWADSWGFTRDLHYTIGPGVRYHTPIGPLRLDFGYQLNPIPNLLVNGSPQRRRWRLHFSIGQAF